MVRVVSWRKIRPLPKCPVCSSWGRKLRVFGTQPRSARWVGRISAQWRRREEHCDYCRMGLYKSREDRGGPQGGRSRNSPNRRVCCFWKSSCHRAGGWDRCDICVLSQERQGLGIQEYRRRWTQHPEYTHEGKQDWIRCSSLQR